MRSDIFISVGYYEEAPLITTRSVETIVIDERFGCVPDRFILTCHSAIVFAHARPRLCGRIIEHIYSVCRSCIRDAGHLQRESCTWYFLVHSLWRLSSRADLWLYHCHSFDACFDLFHTRASTRVSTCFLLRHAKSTIFFVRAQVPYV